MEVIIIIATHLSAPDTSTSTVQLDAVPFKTFKLLSLSEPCEVKVGLVKQDVIWQSDQFGSWSVLSSTKSQSELKSVLTYDGVKYLSLPHP